MKNLTNVLSDYNYNKSKWCPSLGNYSKKMNSKITKNIKIWKFQLIWTLPVSSEFFRTAWNVPRLHYTITTKELSDSIRQLARLSAASTLSGVFPPSSPSMFVCIPQCQWTLLRSRVRTSPFAANLTLKLWGRSFSLRIASHQLSPPHFRDYLFSRTCNPTTNLLTI